MLPPPPLSPSLLSMPFEILTGNKLCLYKHKYNADGSLNRYKARLVANGRSQQQGIDCDATFSPVVKPATIRTVLSLAVSRQWPIHQLDVKNVFLHGHLTETVYMHQPPGFTDSAHSDYVCLLQKSLYGLKQASRAWFQRFSSYVIRAGFYHSKTDLSLFIFHKGPNTAYLLLYVDDIILTASSTSLLQCIISLLHAEFAMTDLGPLNYFLGISATRTTSGIFLTPIDTEKKLGPEGSPVTDPTLYRSLAGSLQYLTDVLSLYGGEGCVSNLKGLDSDYHVQGALSQTRYSVMSLSQFEQWSSGEHGHVVCGVFENCAGSVWAAISGPDKQIPNIQIFIIMANTQRHGYAVSSLMDTAYWSSE
ncbi:ribonuclease H-like domain-containing protein [Tanacetum coccineum]